MGIYAIITVLTGSLLAFIFGVFTRWVLRNEGTRYTQFAEDIIKASLLLPVIYGALVLVIGLAPIN